MSPPFPVSLVVPVRNEAATLPALIAGIEAQTCPPAEVILVDGGSTDDSVARARALTAGDDRFRLVPAPAGTPGRNRNAGAAAARHEWIAFTDAGTRADPDWLERLVEQVRRNPSAEVVYGHYEPVADHFFARASALAFVPPTVERPGGRMRGPSIASLLLRRGVWEAAGGFPDLRAAEDLLFMEAVAEGGFRVAWAPRATVRWQLPSSPGSLFRRFSLYAFHNALIGRQWDWHWGVGRHYAVVALCIALALLHSPGWWLAIPAWLGARIAIALWRRRKDHRPAALLNPVRALAVGAIILIIDVATLAGWLRAALRGRTQVSPRLSAPR